MNEPLKEKLPQGDEIWLLLARKAFGFVENSHGKQVRPYMMMLYEISPQTSLLGSEMLAEKNIGKFPKQEAVMNILVEAMKTSKDEKTPAHRPKAIVFTSPRLFKELSQPLLNLHGIVGKLWSEEENQGFGDEFLKKYCTRLREKQALGYKTSALKPGLSSVLTDKIELATYMKSMAAFFRASPWKQFPVGDALIVTWPEAGSRIFFSYPPNQETKIGIETSPAELKHLFSTGKRATLYKSLPDAYHRMMVYTDEFSMPFDDLYDIDMKNLEIGANPKEVEFCWPFPICFRNEMSEFFRPPMLDFEWLEVGFNGIVKLTEDINKSKVEPGAKKVKYSVTLHSRVTEVEISHYVRQKEFQGLEELWNEVSIAEQKRVEKVVETRASEHDPDACRVCKRKGIALKKCGKCKLKLYCSRECQIKDWEKHKLICVERKDDPAESKTEAEKK